MRPWLLLVILLADCGPSTARTAPVKDPPSNTSTVKPRPSEPDKIDPEELALLHTAADDELGPLAEYYLARGAFDEFAAVRSRMVEQAPQKAGPAPGGPFPRIGAPRTTPRPSTYFGRWINPTDLPELYGKPEVSTKQLADQLREAAKRDPKSPIAQRRLGDALCARLRFREAEAAYTAAVNGGDSRAKERISELRPILHPNE